eukprot:CAMPEP_0172005510 /NCGR_PEP_ID=MMETSP1041-20130122/5082_1 /TAXON_ID=464988 /ORGANISM="Hemiselmis andersenii, Strain CCMP439" /LENGTH=169 /DNA_ID=CAMNT_0012659503 /DNA_START=71 /DNA_END=576 /DNA_ORIENTATION=-
MGDPTALFAEAVRAVVHRWTALNLAVHNDWGCGQSSEKRDQMIAEICSGFQAKKNVDPSEVEEFLDNFLISQFNTDADDESPYEVSHLICRLHTLIHQGDIATAQGLLSSPVASLDKCVAEAGAESDLDGDSSGDDDGEELDMVQEEKEPEVVNFTAEQQADLDDGWGV